MAATEAKVTSKGQITLPLPVRKRLQIGPGDKIVFIEGSDGKILVRGKSGTLADMRGILREKVRLPSAEVVEGWVDQARSRAWSARLKRRRNA
jgi:AbrB family looped-hinge helix DNA binding protein